MSLLERLGLRAAVFAAGALLMALEVAAFRIIGKTFGSALRETTAVIAVFLAAMAAGYWAGGRTADRWPRGMTLVTTLLVAAATLLLVPSIDGALSWRIAASSFALATHAFAATTVLFALPTFLLAATSPIAIRLFATTTGQSGSNAGSISALSTSGSIVGSVVTAFLLIDWLGSISRTVTLVAAGTLATALLVLVTQRSRPRFALAGAATLVGIIGAAALLRAHLAQPIAGDRRPVFVGDSAYHHIVVRDRGPIRELRFNLAVQSQMLRADPTGAGAPYTDALHLARLMRPNIRRVLMIGLGGGTAARQFTHYYPDVVVDAVEVDPMVVDVARRFFDVQPGPRLRIHVADGRTFLKQARERWDLIIVDAYSTNRYGDTIPPHLATREFFQEASSRLTEGGIVHFHCAYTNSKLMRALHQTMGSVFASVLVTSGELLASNVPLIVDQGRLLAAANASPARRLPVIAAHIAGLDAGPPPRDTLVLTDDYAPVDTLLGRH